MSRPAVAAALAGTLAALASMGCGSSGKDPGGGPDLPATVPNAPSGLVAFPGGIGAITVTWVDEATNETSYEIERAPASTGPYGTVFTAAADATSHTDPALVAGSTYWYRVRAVNARGGSEYAGPASSITGIPAPPGDPVLVGRAERVGMADVGLLDWVDVPNEASYELRWYAVGAWSTPISLPANTTSYVDESTPLGAEIYALRAVNAGGASNWSELAMSRYMYFTIIIGFVVCAPPTSVSATATGGTSVRLDWTNSSMAECPVVGIEKGTSATGPWSSLGQSTGSGSSSAGSWTDTAAAGTTSWYRLRAFANPGTNAYSSAYSATVSATIPSSVPAPTGLVVAATSATTAHLTWNDVATETAYAIDYATGSVSGPFTEVFQVPANSTSVDVTELLPGATQWFRVRALQGAASSAPSNVASVTTPTRIELTATADNMIVESTAIAANQNLNIPNDVNGVGCTFTWTFDQYNQTFLFHNCVVSVMKFDTSVLAGKTVRAAALVMTPCALAPVRANAIYAAFAIAGAWNPATATGNSFPAFYTSGGWQIPAPAALTPASAWDVTSIVRNWVNAAWTNNGIEVRQWPVADRASNDDQTTSYCSREVGGSLAFAPRLIVDYQ